MESLLKQNSELEETLKIKDGMSLALIKQNNLLKEHLVQEESQSRHKDSKI